MIGSLDKIHLGFDVVIVGAGTAGCTLANNLSDNFRVLLIDSKDFPRRKACSGILVSEGVKCLDEPLNDSLLIEPTTLDLEYVDVDNSRRKVTKKSFQNMDRFEFDKSLFKKVLQKENVTFLQNTKLVEFAYADDKKHKVVVCESRGEIKPVITKYLIGCDGALSLIRKKIFKRDIPFYVGVQELIKYNGRFERAYFIFDNEITDFYSWVIPKGGYVEVGALLDPYNSRERFILFKKKIETMFNITGEGNISSAIVLRPRSVKDICLGEDNVLLCGEAAGLISPSSAEGISYALRSAKYCAEAINSKREGTLLEYKNKCKPLIERLDKKFKKSKLLSSPKARKAMFD